MVRAGGVRLFHMQNADIVPVGSASGRWGMTRSDGGQLTSFAIRLTGMADLPMISGIHWLDQ